MTRDDFSISGRASDVDDDQIGPKPMRDVNGKCGVMFFADGILARLGKCFTNAAINARLTINQKNLLQHFHEITSRFPSIGCATESTARMSAMIIRAQSLTSAA